MSSPSWTSQAAANRAACSDPEAQAESAAMVAALLALALAIQVRDALPWSATSARRDAVEADYLAARVVFDAAVEAFEAAREAAIARADLI